MKKTLLLLTACSVFACGVAAGEDKTFAPADNSCDAALTQHLFDRFDYWMKKYNHRDDSVSTSFSQFPSYDDALFNVGASYEDYLCLADLAKTEGYSISFVIRDAGYSRQMRRTNDGDDECKPVY